MSFKSTEMFTYMRIVTVFLPSVLSLIFTFFLSFFFIFWLLSFFFVFFLSFVLSLVFAILHTSAISCTRLKFDYQMAVYEHYVYGDVHIINCYCVFSFLSVTGFTDKCNILHEAGF